MKHASSTQEVPAHGEVPRHIAIILDGNGRWARSRMLPRIAGHRRGLEAVRATVQNCADQRRIHPGGRAAQAAKPGPLEAACRDDQRDQHCEPELRQQEKGSEKCGDQRGRGGEPRGERAAQATSARLPEVEEAATCSLVRPKRRSRWR